MNSVQSYISDESGERMSLLGMVSVGFPRVDVHSCARDGLPMDRMLPLRSDPHQDRMVKAPGHIIVTAHTLDTSAGTRMRIAGLNGTAVPWPPRVVCPMTSQEQPLSASMRRYWVGCS